MPGILNATIWLVYILCIVGTGACIVYGVVNKSREKERIQIQEEADCEKAEQG